MQLLVDIDNSKNPFDIIAEGFKMDRVEINNQVIYDKIIVR
jgi:hypothetical protein